MQVLASYIEIYQESIRDLLLETSHNDDPNKPKVHTQRNHNYSIESFANRILLFATILHSETMSALKHLSTKCLYDRMYTDKCAICDALSQALISKMPIAYNICFAHYTVYCNAQPAIREHKKEGIYLENVDERVVASAKDVLALAREGAKRRAVGETSMNSQSSRSHAVLTLRWVSDVLHVHMHARSFAYVRVYVLRSLLGTWSLAEALSV
jgi:Kinesin motor domain